MILLHYIELKSVLSSLQYCFKPVFSVYMFHAYDHYCKITSMPCDCKCQFIPCVCIYLNTQAEGSSKMLVPTGQSTWCHNLEDCSVKCIASVQKIEV